MHGIKTAKAPPRFRTEEAIATSNDSCAPEADGPPCVLSAQAEPSVQSRSKAPPQCILPHPPTRPTDEGISQIKAPTADDDTIRVKPRQNGITASSTSIGPPLPKARSLFKAPPPGIKKAAPPLFTEGLLPPKAPPAGFDESIAVVSNTPAIRKMPPPLVDPWAAPGEDRIIDPWAAAPAAARG